MENVPEERDGDVPRRRRGNVPERVHRRCQECRDPGPVHRPQTPPRLRRPYNKIRAGAQTRKTVQPTTTARHRLCPRQLDPAHSVETRKPVHVHREALRQTLLPRVAPEAAVN